MDMGPKNTNSLASNIFEELILVYVMRYFLMLSAAMWVMCGCRPDTKIDVIAPEFAALTMNGYDTTTWEVAAGDTLNVVVGLSDNEAVDEMQAVIHGAEDGHTHSGYGHGGGEFHLNSGTWQWSEVRPFAGPNTIRNEYIQLIVPDTLAGNWHLVITAKDRVGNTSKEYVALITVNNQELPLVTGTTTPAADATGTVYLTTGAALLLDGAVEDADGLAEIKTYLMTYSGGTGEVTPVAMQGVPTAWTFQGVSFDNAQPGTYRVVIEAKDALGHRRYWDRRVIVQ
jgi:Domain of unknown function (DUF4625)